MAERSIEQAVQAYVAAWNTDDEVGRRELLTRCFAAAGTYVDPTARVTGRDALVAHSRRYVRRWPGASIALTSRVDEHDGVGCFTWRTVGPDGATLAEGIDFVAVDADGLLSEVRGFFGRYRSPHDAVLPSGQ